MNRISDFISEEFLGHAAFMLLSSSSIDRYIRTAKSLSFASQLKQYLDLSIFTDDDLLKEADSLWRQILQKDKRDIPEIKLAILLPLAAEFASDKASNILLDIALQDRSPASWVSALARHLFNNRRTNIEFREEVKTLSIISFSSEMAQTANYDI